MPRQRVTTQTIENEAAATVPDWDKLDENAKRRLRNRLSQRHFRERRLMYIKGLERQNQAKAQTESERNRTLLREMNQLRDATLNVRAQILKISHSLNELGAEVARHLNLENHAASDTESSPSTRQSPALECQRASSQQQMDDTEIATQIPEEVAEGDKFFEKNTGPNFDDLFGPYEDLGGIWSSQQLSESRLGAQDPHANVPEEMPQHSPTFRPPRRDSGEGCSDLQVQDDVQPPLAHWEQPSSIGSPLSTIMQRSLVLPQGHLPQTTTNGHPCFAFQPSKFSQHVEALELQARQRIDISTGNSTRQILYRCCSTIMSLFIQNAWPSTCSVWAKSQVPDIIGPILLWRLYPTTETYNLLGPNYKPTELQLSVPHAPVIDWIPYSELRDRVIMYYNSTVVLDRLLCDMLNSYVVEVDDLSTVLPKGPKESGYFGIWNLFRAIDVATASIASEAPSHPDRLWFGQEDEGCPNSFDLSGAFTLSHGTPSPSSNQGSDNSPRIVYNLLEIFSKPAAVLKLAHDARLYASKSWRFDGALFETWPELKFNGYESIVAKGRSLRIATAPPESPKEMTSTMMETYHKVIAELA